MTVFVVTQGSYSDYSICAIFSTREKAVEHMGGFPGEFNDIEEYDLDSLRPRKLTKQWNARLNWDGSVHQYENKNPSVIDVVEAYVGERGGSYTFTWRGGAFVGMSYVSYEHAMKLAVEERQKAMREHPEWFTE